MDDERLLRVGRNEALYRQVNEQIKGINLGTATMTGDFGVICECGTLGCTTQIMVSPHVYEQTRTRSDHFIVLPGHQIDEIEVVVADHGTFYVIEKTPPEAKRLAEEMDPRT